MGIFHPALVQQRMDLGAHCLGVADVLLLAFAGGRAVPFEGPGETHGLAVVFGDDGAVPFHHGRDGVVPTRAEALKQTVVQVGVEGRDGPCDGARGRCDALTGGGIRSLSWDEGVPSPRHGAEAVRAEGEDLVLDGLEVRYRRVGVVRDPAQVAEVFLLSFVHDSTHKV